MTATNCFLRLYIVRSTLRGTAYIIGWRVGVRGHFAYSHFAYLLPLSAISPTQAKCDQNNVKQLKQAVQAF